MAGIVERSAVHQHEVLVDAAAAHAEACGAFGGGLHARHHLDHTDYVSLTHEGRKLANNVAGDSFFAELRQRQLLSLALGEDFGCLEHLTVFFEEEILFQGACGIDGNLGCDIAGIGAFDDLGFAVYLKGIEAEIVGGDAGAEILSKNDGSDKGLAAGRFLHISGQHSFLRRHRQHTHQHPQHQNRYFHKKSHQGPFCRNNCAMLISYKYNKKPAREESAF